MENNMATWIWYPGDFEIWLGNIMNSRRTERGTFFPPFWKMDSHYVTVEFSRQVELAEPETIDIRVEGRYNVKVDGKMLFGEPTKVELSAGSHKINIKVWNQSTPPSIFVDGKTIKSNSSWLVTNEDKEWIDESGKASDTSASIYMNAGYWNFNSPDTLPSAFRLPTTEEKPVSQEKVSDGILYDFGKETFGFVRLNDVQGNGLIRLFYGESAEEATDTEHCETLDILSAEDAQVTDLSKAFRYVFVRTEGDVTISSVDMLYEYLPEQERGTFKCDDELVNKMWQVGVRTLQLTTREFFIDGIKRDRWTWSGDATQSYLMNYYLFFDSETVKRTMRQLRGKDPITSHVNTIMDYTFYWLISVSDYYLYSGDKDFVREIYPRMKTLMDYCLSRTDENGMMQGLSGDWVFVDWSPSPMDKHGELSFEQILFCRSLEAMAECADIADNSDDAKTYSDLASRLRAKLLPTFWDENLHAIIHNVVPSNLKSQTSNLKSQTSNLKPAVTRYSNIFGILFDYLSPDQQKEVAKSVLHNDNVMRITTPYMRFYEMEALCKLGEQTSVLKEMKDYWGGMIAHGATSFWEAYDAKIDADAGGNAPLRDHLSMYGRPYGKSLCHAWGASPIYLLGKFFLGVKPTKPGYGEWEARPNLGTLQWMEGTVPTPIGSIRIRMDGSTITVHSDEGNGVVVIPEGKEPKANAPVSRGSDGLFRVAISPGKDVTIEYSSSVI